MRPKEVIRLHEKGFPATQESPYELAEEPVPALGRGSSASQNKTGKSPGMPFRHLKTIETRAQAYTLGYNMQAIPIHTKHELAAFEYIPACEISVFP